jgi:hypothetical protein
MRRLQVATKDFGPEGIELFKVATLQYVQKQLRELQDVLSWVQGGPQPLQHVPPSGTLHPAPTAPAIRQLTPAEADAIALKAQAQVAQAPEKACQFCGQHSVYVSRRGVPHCIRHKAQGQADDQDELLSNKMRNQAFGEVIYVNPGNSGGE